MANTFYMPARGERAAPSFDITKPRELIRFFEELEYLFTRADLKDETEKKKHVLCYVDFDIEQIWKTFIPRILRSNKNLSTIQGGYPSPLSGCFRRLRILPP